MFGEFLFGYECGCILVMSGCSLVISVDCGLCMSDGGRMCSLC